MRRSVRYIFVMLALAFIAWLALDYSGVVGQATGSPGDVVGKVNGSEIQLQTYYEALRQEQERRRANDIPPALTLEDQRLLEDQVFEELLQRVLLEQEYKRRGIRVTDQEVIEAAQNLPLPEVLEVPDFQTEGQFDITKYRAFIQSGANPAFLQAIEARYREQIPQIKLFQQLTAGVYVSDSELWGMYRDQHDSVTVRLLHIRPEQTIADASVAITDAELEAYYRRNREDFKEPAEAFLSYVEVARSITVADSQFARERAQAVLEEIRDDADFAAVARRESGDTASRVQGGSLGWVPRGRMVPALDSAAFSLEAGEVSELVTTQFGYHIIKAENVTPDSAELRHILVRVELSGDRLMAAEGAADSLDRIAAQQLRGAVLDSAAAHLTRPVEQTRLREGPRLILNGRLVPDVGVWAFTVQTGETSHVIEAPQAYYVFRLDSLIPERVPPLEEVRNAIVQRVRGDKKREAARAMAASIALTVSTGISLEGAAQAEGLEADVIGPFTRSNPAPQLFRQPEVLGAAFGLPVGEISGVLEAEVGFFFVEPISRKPVDQEAWRSQVAAQRQVVLQQLRQQRVAEFMQALRASADVVDRRRDIERRTRELAERGPGPFSRVGF